MADEPYIDADARVHPSATVAPGTQIWNWTKVREGAVLGADCNVGQCCYIDAGVTIGERCKIQNGVSVYAGVTLEDEVFVGPNATFTNDLRPRAQSPSWDVVPTRVCRGASVGANATIVCGVTLGRFCMVGAGAVVTADVPEYALVLGAPARIVGYVDERGERRVEEHPDEMQMIDDLG